MGCILSCCQDYQYENDGTEVNRNEQTPPEQNQKPNEEDEHNFESKNSVTVGLQAKGNISVLEECSFKQNQKPNEEDKHSFENKNFVTVGLEAKGSISVHGECSHTVIKNASELNYKRDVVKTDNAISHQINNDFIPLKYRYRCINPIDDCQITDNERLPTFKVGLIDNIVIHGWKFETVYKGANFVCIPLKSQEGKAVINIFSHDNRKIKLQVTEISRIENHFLYAMYLLKKKEMECRNGYVNELNLFHGTKKENVKSICNNNFDWRRFGKSKGNRFGQGISFTPKATYARHYCDDEQSKVMFLAKVLVSKAITGHVNMSIPYDLFNGKLKFQDTSVKDDIDVIVKYGDNEFYPAYRITFFVSNTNFRPLRRN